MDTWYDGDYDEVRISGTHRDQTYYQPGKKISQTEGSEFSTSTEYTLPSIEIPATTRLSQTRPTFETLLFESSTKTSQDILEVDVTTNLDNSLDFSMVSKSPLNESFYSTSLPIISVSTYTSEVFMDTSLEPTIHPEIFETTEALTLSEIKEETTYNALVNDSLLPFPNSEKYLKDLCGDFEMCGDDDMSDSTMLFTTSTISVGISLVVSGTIFLLAKKCNYDFRPWLDAMRSVVNCVRNAVINEENDLELGERQENSENENNEPGSAGGRGDTETQPGSAGGETDSLLRTESLTSFRSSLNTSTMQPKNEPRPEETPLPESPTSSTGSLQRDIPGPSSAIPKPDLYKTSQPTKEERERKAEPEPAAPENKQELAAQIKKQAKEAFTTAAAAEKQRDSRLRQKAAASYKNFY